MLKLYTKIYGIQCKRSYIQGNKYYKIITQIKIEETHRRGISEKDSVLLLRVADELQQPIENYILARVKDQAIPGTKSTNYLK